MNEAIVVVEDEAIVVVEDETIVVVEDETIVISSYHHIIIPYHPIIPSQLLSYQSSHTTNCKSVLAEKSTKKWKSSFLPLRQKSEGAEIRFIGGSFSRPMCHWCSKIHSSSKTARS